MRFHLKFLLPIVSLLLLAACAELVVKEVDYADAPIVPETAHPAPIKFSKMNFLLPPGTEIGLESGMGPALLGHFCSARNYPVSRRVVRNLTENKYVKDTFARALEANGYDVVDSLDMDFRPEDELARAEYFVSVRITDIDVDLCKRGRLTTFNIFNTAEGAKGKLYAKFDWSVYDALRRKVVYKTSTEGYSRRDYPNTEGLELLFYDAFEMATHNLSADPDFYALIVEGKAPPKQDKDRTLEDVPGKFDPLEKVDVEALPLSRQPVPKHIDEIRANNVMIQKVGHGSGFFITKQGHILTNQHVVGDAKRMRIVTKGKKYKLIAEVLRVDKVRDVALLKLEEIPPGLKINPLPLRTDKLTVSEDVYALGNPYDYGKLQDSITKGIVSAHRIYKTEGVRLPFIQADVEVHGGHSGGALLDEYGNIVGIAQSAYTNEGVIGVGLNFFIPIAEALKTLDITIDGAQAPAYTPSDEESEELSADESYETPIDLVK